MAEIPGMQNVLDLVQRYKEYGVKSTGAKVVDFAGNLYNVDLSTDDPKKIPGNEGAAWKQLLIAYGISPNSQCYVTNPGAEGSHPNFSVGGHMTTNRDGSVPEGGSCYLMPLCYWHNGKKNDGVSFSHTATKMLQLTGYMQGELAATFQLRLPNENPYAVLYYSEEGWKYRDLWESETRNLRAEIVPKIQRGSEANYVLFERVRDVDTLHFVREVNLPGSVS